MASILQNYRIAQKFLKISMRRKKSVRAGTTMEAKMTAMEVVRNRCTHILPNDVLVEKDEQITLIGLNRAEYRNSIDLKTSKALSEAIDQFESDVNSPIAVLYGVGGSISAGHDVRDLEQQLEQNNYNYFLNPVGTLAPTRRHLRKPIVCAINGYCVAGGLELALLCDLRVMEDTAVLGFFQRRLGVPTLDGGTVRLAKLIGYSRALDLILSGRRMKAEEAFEIGLINRIVATGTSLGQAVNLAFSISKYSQSALCHDRTSIYTNVYEPKTFDETIQEQLLLSDEVISELKSGIQKFVKSETKGGQTDAFNVKEKPVPDWEKEEIRIENQYKNKKILHS